MEDDLSARRLRHASELKMHRNEQARRQQQLFLDLPTISDEKYDPAPMEWESVTEEQARIINAINDPDEMEKLGRMAFENVEELHRLFAMPPYLLKGHHKKE